MVWPILLPAMVRWSLIMNSLSLPFLQCSARWPEIPESIVERRHELSDWSLPRCYNRQPPLLWSTREIKQYNRGCRLRGFSEGLLTFNPLATYKYDPRSDEYDSPLRHRFPAWRDRILWRSRVANRVQQLHYKRYEANMSDHWPVSAALNMKLENFVAESVAWEIGRVGEGVYISQALILSYLRVFLLQKVPPRRQLVPAKKGYFIHLYLYHHFHLVSSQ